MKFINSLEEYNDLLKYIIDKDIVILPTLLNPYDHHSKYELSLLYILVENESFIIGIDHPDLFCIDKKIIKNIKANIIWTIDYKTLYKFIEVDINDINMLVYLNENEIPEWLTYTNAHFFYRRHDNLLNKIIPVSKHIEIHQHNIFRIVDIIKKYKRDKVFNIYSKFLNTIVRLENKGIKTNSEILKKYYGQDVNPFIYLDNLIYTNYSFYTSTGRPSNTFGNINFSAINKDNGARQSLIPKNDFFVLYDYDSFHLNLMAKILKFKFDENNIHNYLGKFYFGKDILTNEEYETTKKLNFKYLYGGIPQEISDEIPFFAKVQDLMFLIWREMKKNGYFESILTGRKIFMNKIENPNVTKVFNYFIQSMEMEIGMILIEKLLDLLEKYKTELILYTYDGFLFDYSVLDKKEVLLEINKILEICPYKVLIGKDYHNLKKIK